MSKYLKRVNGEGVVNLYTGEFKKTLNKAGEGENKLFAVVLMCGHCGKMHYIPIVFSVAARSIDEAKIYAKQIPRVKGDVKGCILGIKEISRAESMLIKYINDRDPYLVYNDKGKDLTRRVVTPEVVEYVNKKLAGAPLDRNDKFKLQSVGEIKTSYSSTYVLQNAYCPKRDSRGRYVIPNPKIDEVLKNYFTQKVWYFGVDGERIHPLSLYLQIYGNNNELGIKYIVDEKNNKTIQFSKKDQNGESVKIVIEPSESAKKILDATIKIEQKGKEENLGDIPHNQIEKFNKKYAQFLGREGK